MESSIEMYNAILKHIEHFSYVLEPSAGKGGLVFQLIEKKECIVDCIELNENNYQELISLQNKEGLLHKITHGDFLKQPIFDKEMYNHVAMIPPYKDNIDCAHIRAAYDIIKPAGSVIAFTLPTWITGFYSNQVEFRKWLSNKKYKIELFEGDESYLSCPKMLLIIEK